MIYVVTWLYIAIQFLTFRYQVIRHFEFGADAKNGQQFSRLSVATGQLLDNTMYCHVGWLINDSQVDLFPKRLNSQCELYSLITWGTNFTEEQNIFRKTAIGNELVEFHSPHSVSLQWNWVDAFFDFLFVSLFCRSTHGWFCMYGQSNGF